jgi:hypothetical protein
LRRFEIGLGFSEELFRCGPDRQREGKLLRVLLLASRQSLFLLASGPARCAFKSLSAASAPCAARA